MTTEDDKPAVGAPAPAAASDPHDSLDSSPPSTDNPPRKRSKVSRACDACRRKKIRCNAEYSPTLSKVTRVCNNCTKNNEVCAFSRIPLKRGPSKGYIRDLEDKLDRSKDPRPPAAAPSYAYGPPPVPQQLGVVHPHHQPLPFPHNHLKVSPPGSGQALATGSSPIVLPPLADLHSKIMPPKFSPGAGPAAAPTTTNTTTPSNPSSPRSNSINGLLNLADSAHLATKNSSPPIQGPFWKVPYEMPAGPSRRSSLSLLNGSAASSASGASSRRRSSIDSISSTSTNGSRLASLKSSGADLVSDSDSEDFYSVRSNVSSSVSVPIPPLSRSSSANHHRRQSSTASPRNSVSSLSSLSGRINTNLHIQNSPSIASNPPPAYPQPYPQPPASSQFQYAPGPGSYHFPSPQYQTAHPPPPPPPPAANHAAPSYYPAAPPSPSYRANLAVYYTHFHPDLPILPFDQAVVVSLMEAAAADGPSPAAHIVELFNHALHNLVNFKKVSLAANVSMMMRLLALYPFAYSGIAPKENHLMLFFTSLALLNYTMLLNGDVYTAGLSLSVSIFNDFKVLETFAAYVKDTPEPNKDFDNIKLYLPKLYYVLNIIDDLYSLSFGLQKSINSNELLRFLKTHLDYLVPRASSSLSINPGLVTFKQSRHFEDLIRTRDGFLLGQGPQAATASHGFQNAAPTEDEFSDHFANVIKEKYDLVRCLFEINHFIANVNSRNDVDDVFENLMDHNLKLIRLTKKISTTIVNFANYISTATPSDGSPTHSSAVSPNRSHNNSTTSINEITSNVTKSPGSPAYNSPSPYSGNIVINPLLNITIGQLFKLIKLNKLIIDSLISLLRSQNKGHPDLLNRCVKINNDLSISFNLLNLNLVNLQLGSGAINTIRSKISGYMLNFNIQGLLHSKPEEENLSDLMANWGQNFRNFVIPFIENESAEGWF